MSENIANMSDHESDSHEVLLRNGTKPNNLTTKGKTTNLEKNPVNFEVENLKYEYLRLRRYLYGLTAVVVAGILILIIVIAVLFGKLSHDLVSHEHKPKVGEQIAALLKKDDLCVPCDNIRLGPSAEESKMLDTFSRKHDSDGTELCCVETPKELLLMLELFIERRYRQETARGMYSLSLSLSLNLIYSRLPEFLIFFVNNLFFFSVPGLQYEIQEWVWDADLAFMHHVSYRHGRIVVPSNGLYYIYSQMAFLEYYPNGKVDNSVANSLSHYLYRYNVIYPRGGEEKLAQNSVSKCISSNKQFAEYTSYLGALFQLRQGDEVFVKVSNLSLVGRDPKLIYFGLFKLSALS
ncbi:hypothetical protein FSP39_000747 [Pinctada imbricata]|uniref:THD domain-containing protein n=1 Tax=Pinctada imbricata TaxID=66713 RepID=A0AA88Y7I4_PINIB|nr:hypothetical protein FSP39_000747 [Pinctada imbricata]